MKRKVLFYRLILNRNINFNLLEDDTTLPDAVESLSDAQREADRIFILDNKVVFLISFDRNHIFGTFGKIEDMSSGDTVRVRDRETFSVTDFENLVETYTYFYLDLSTNHLALIYKSGIPDIKKPLENFILTHFRLTALFNAEIVIEKDQSIPTRYGANIPVAKIKVKYASDGDPGNIFASPTEILQLSQSDVREGDMNIVLNEGTTVEHGIINRLFETFNEQGYRQFQIITDEETIDLIEQTVIKKSSIEFEDGELNDHNSIKRKLTEILHNNF